MEPLEEGLMVMEARTRNGNIEKKNVELALKEGGSNQGFAGQGASDERARKNLPVQALPSHLVLRECYSDPLPPE